MVINVTKHTPAYWTIGLNNPPLNLYTQAMINELRNLLTQLESNEEINVLVFESMVPDFFMAHVDLMDSGGTLSLEAGPTGLSPWPDFAVRLENAPFVTIAKIRGRARAVGSEFALAMDMRFASKEKAILAQAEVGFGLFPGGGGMERLPLLVGRGRALEIILSADDYDADTAEKYGWINRSIPDTDLDGFVDKLAHRISGFDRSAIAATKRFIGKRAGLAQKDDLAETQEAFFEALTSPTPKARITEMFVNGLQQKSDVELNLGYHLGKPEIQHIKSKSTEQNQ